MAKACSLLYALPSTVPGMKQAPRQHLLSLCHSSKERKNRVKELVPTGPGTGTGERKAVVHPISASTPREGSKQVQELRLLFL